jgi:hypothetical protein
MENLDSLIKNTGLKKEWLIKETKINRNKFYLALKFPQILNDNELTRLSLALNIDKQYIISIINAGNQATGLHH